MDGPFRSWHDKPAQLHRSYPSLFGEPVYPVDPTRQARRPAYSDGLPPVEKKSGRRVVQIPVQFFGSDSDRRSESALIIQKVFRGFFVRKSVRKIKEIKAQVDEIEARLLRDEVAEMIRGNERERLRMSESLMNLLLKLDGIRGIDFGIRVCRKGVTRKAIALQEKIDAICAPDSEGKADCEVEIGSQELEDGLSAAANFEGPRFGGNSEKSNDFEEIMEDSGEELKIEAEREMPEDSGEELKMEVGRDSVLTENLDAVVASEVNPGGKTHLVTEMEMGTSKNIDFDEDSIDSVKEMLVDGAGKEDDANENVEFLANSELGEIIVDVREEHGGGKDFEVERQILEVERNHLDTEFVGVPATSVIEVTPETYPVQGTPKNLDFDDGDAETVKEMLAFSDTHGERLCDSSEELNGGGSLGVEDKTMEVDREHLDSESDAGVKASPEMQGVKETPENLHFGVEGAESTKEMSTERSGEDKAVMENDDLAKKKCELLEQMMEENKKMMLMVTQLNERNEMQLQMLDALTNRVESLEKAYLCDKLRTRRKKMKKNKCAVTCIED